jgi:hypothetical protein
MLLLLLPVCCMWGAGCKCDLSGIAGDALHAACDARRQRP